MRLVKSAWLAADGGDSNRSESRDVTHFTSPLPRTHYSELATSYSISFPVTTTGNPPSQQIGASRETASLVSRIADRLQSLDNRTIFVLVIVASTFAFLPYRFWKQPSIVDRANWDYFAQVIARGGIPYVDVVNIKAPLSAYIGALAILAGKLVGLRDIFAIRLVYLALADLVVAFTFVVALDYFKSRRIAVLAAAIMMAVDLFGDANCGGVQPKTPMILFGLMTLWSLRRDRPFLAGLYGMLSALSWQPGLLFAGVAALSFSHYLTRWRDLKALKVIAGAALPLAIFIGYFWIEGALRELYWWNIDYNLTIDAPRGLRTVEGIVDRFDRLMRTPYRRERIYFLASVFGLLVVGWSQLREAFRSGTRRLLDAAPDHSIILAALIYFAFCTINIQGGVDLIPLLPFVSMFAAVAIISLVGLIANLANRARLKVPQFAVQQFGFAIALALVIVFSIGDVIWLRVWFPTLQDQEAEVAQITSLLEPGDQIFVHGLAEILVLSGRTNADKHFFLDRGKDTYLDKVEPGGFEGWFSRLKSKRPKIVALERLKTLDHKEEFINWVQTDYEEEKGKIFTYYVRKINDPPSDHN